MAKLNLQKQIDSTRYCQSDLTEDFEDFISAKPTIGSAKNITMLPLEQLVEYRDEAFESITGHPQPFRPYESDALASLAKSIAEHGVIDPITVRPIGADKYQILAGRNRTRASAMCGKKTVPAIIRADIDDVAAAMIMLDTNLEQRHNLCYSEKAFAYKMRIDLQNRQGKRTDLCDDHQKVDTLSEAGKEHKDSRRTVAYLIRLTYLIPEILALVDNGKIGFKVGVAISYLTSETQQYLNKNIIQEGIKIKAYVVPDKQTVAVEWNKVTNKSFVNTLKKWNVTVTKSDRETGTAQGDATLSGAVYGIYKGELLIDTYTTDENGQFTTKYYVCGDDWSVREITPSEGYLLDESAHHIGAESRNYTVEYNSTANDVLETIIKGKIALIKHTDDGSTQLETPEVGAEFEVFLKKTGSYENSENTERDIIACDKNGFAQTKDLPYGIYTVHQVKGWNGREFLPDFDVYIREDGQTYRYLANNASFESYIKIIKTDAESGCVIPYADAAFRLYDPDGNKIVMSYTYPEYTEIDTFYTTGDGMLITPQKLEYGKGYSLVEVSAPYGYVLDSTPIYFDVAADTATEDGAITVVKVSRPNMPQKGIIKINKSGEVFSSVMESEGIYQPVYSVQGLQGAVYEITAAEDIITPDGTLRYAVGEVVDTVTTGETGIAVSKQLYLGRYEIKEITAPYGTVLNTEIHTAELVYAGQEIEITEISAGFCNERQKATVSLEKIMEQDELFGIGQNNEIRSVQFGLFAAEDLTAADGSVIPADGLLEAIYCAEKGEACFTTDLPVGANCYVHEIATDCSYVLSDEKYPIVFEYAGQNTALVEIKANNGNAITNEILRGTVKGMKTDRETGEVIEGAVFGLFASNETEYNENTALLTAASDENGVFSFEDIPFGSWIIKELQPADGYLPNDEVYTVEITEHGQLIEISVVNDKIPEIETKASVDGKKEICATEVFTLEDTVSYRHLIPGKEYTVSGVLMNKTTKAPLIIDGAEIRSETIFIPDDPTGEVTVSFTFDSKYIKEDTDIVVFESLSCEGAILTSHEDIDDPDQTITVRIPKICTYASAYGRKDVMSDSCVAIDDTVSYVNLTPGREYTVKGILMDKSTGNPFLENGKEICSEIVFIPNTSNGYITVSFVLDAKQITDTAEIVAFETLYRNGIEIASHTDIEDMEQTVTIKKPPIEVPQTGDNSHLLLWSALMVVSGALLVFIGVYRKNSINKKTRNEK